MYNSSKIAFYSAVGNAAVKL